MRPLIGKSGRALRGVSGRFARYGFGVESRGCDFCRDDQNMRFGHVEQVSSNEDKGLLLRCPRCGWLYLDPSDGITEPFPIDRSDASGWFGYTA